MSRCLEMVRGFKNKYPLTISFRIDKHCKIIDMHLNPDEEILYAFAAQKNDTPLIVINTCVVALTNKRIIIGTKRLFWGYFFISITPDMFNDLTVYKGIIFGKIMIDTIKEEVVFTNLDKNSLPEIQNAISSNMMEQKKEYEIMKRNKK